MIIRAQDVYEPLGFTTSWFSARFHHLAKDYLEGGLNAVYEVSDLINECKAYTSNTKNPIQKLHSEAMVRKTLQYLEKL